MFFAAASHRDSAPRSLPPPVLKFCLTNVYGATGGRWYGKKCPTQKYHLENLWKFCIGSCCLEQDHLEKYHLYELFLNVLKWKKLTASRTLQFCSRLTKWHYRHLTQKLQRTGNVEFPCWIEQWHPKVQKCPPTELIIPNYPFHCWFYPPTFSLRVWFFFHHVQPY